MTQPAETNRPEESNPRTRSKILHNRWFWWSLLTLLLLLMGMGLWTVVLGDPGLLTRTGSASNVDRAARSGRTAADASTDKGGTLPRVANASTALNQPGTQHNSPGVGGEVQTREPRNENPHQSASQQRVSPKVRGKAAANVISNRAGFASECGLVGAFFVDNSDEVCGYDVKGRFHFWDASTGRLIRSCDWLVEGTVFAVFDEASNTVFIGTRGGDLYSWPLAEPRPLLVDSIEGMVISAAFGANGKLLFIGCSLGRLVAWNTETRNTVRSAGYPDTSSLLELSLSPDEAELFIMSAAHAGRGDLLLVNTTSLEEIGRAAQFEKGFHPGAVAIGGSRVVFQLDSQRLIWDAAKQKDLVVVGTPDAPSARTALKYDSRSHLVASISSPGNFVLLDPDTLQVVSASKYTCGSDSVGIQLVLSNTGSRAVVVTGLPGILLFSYGRSTQPALVMPMQDRGLPTASCFDEAACRLFLGTIAGRVEVVDLATGDLQKSFSVADAPIVSLAFDAARSALYALTAEVAVVFDTASWHQQSSFDLTEETWASVTPSGQQSCAVILTRSRLVEVWSVSPWKRLARVSLPFRPDRLRYHEASKTVVALGGDSFTSIRVPAEGVPAKPEVGKGRFYNMVFCSSGILAYGDDGNHLAFEVLRADGTFGEHLEVTAPDVDVTDHKWQVVAAYSTGSYAVQAGPLVFIAAGGEFVEVDGVGQGIIIDASYVAWKGKPHAVAVMSNGEVVVMPAK